MNDERLERELRAALLIDDPGPVPDELRLRLSQVPDEAAGRSGRAPRLHRVLMAVEAAAAVAVLGAVLAFAVQLRGVAAGPSGVPTLPTLSAPSSSGPTAQGVVQWVDRPAPSAAEPSASPQPSPDARPCRPSDLRSEVGQIGLAMGNTKLPVTFVNDSPTPCALVGFPSLVGITAAGAEERIPVTHGSYFPDPGPPADLVPGGVGTAEVDISGSDACQAAQAGRHKVYKILRIGLPAGGSVDVGGGGFDTICGVAVSLFGGPTAATTPSVLPDLPLQAEISAPASVAPGSTLAYVVTITNTANSEYALDPCPIFEQFVASGSLSIWVATIRDAYLNCDTVRVIPAHGSVSYEIRLAIPANQPAGEAKFGWDLRGDRGPYANAALRVGAGQ
jgi:hypothetical protein